MWQYRERGWLYVPNLSSCHLLFQIFFQIFSYLLYHFVPSFLQPLWMGSVKKPHRYRPGTVAFCEIRRYQKSTVAQEVAIPASCLWDMSRIEEQFMLPEHSHACPTGGRGGLPYWAIQIHKSLCHACKMRDDHAQGFVACKTNPRRNMLNCLSKWESCVSRAISNLFLLLVW